MDTCAVLTQGNVRYSTTNLGAFIEKFLLLSIRI